MQLCIAWITAHMKTIALFFCICLSFCSSQAQYGPIYIGEGTFYGYGGGGNCSFETPINPVMTCAMNNYQYDSSNACGSCVHINGPKGQVILKVEDRCPECAFGDIDLSEDAFPLIANVEEGRTLISWRFIECPLEKNLELYIKEGSSIFWTAIQVRNHPNAIISVELLRNNEWMILPRSMYNYFVANSGFGEPPYSFRVVNEWNDTLIIENIPLDVTTPISTGMQFPSHENTYTSMVVKELRPGWNLISTNSLHTILNAKKQLNIEAVKDYNYSFEAARYSALNTIEQSDTMLPYSLYANTWDTVVLPTDNSVSSVQLNTGWNFIPYPKSYITPIDSVLAPIWNSVVEIKNTKAMWAPQIPYNELRYFLPLHSYFINVSNDCILEWK